MHACVYEGVTSAFVCVRACPGINHMVVAVSCCRLCGGVGGGLRGHHSTDPARLARE